MEIASRKAVLGIFKTIRQAEAAMAALRRAGLGSDQVGLVVRASNKRTSGHAIVAATPTTPQHYLAALAILGDRTYDDTAGVAPDTATPAVSNAEPGPTLAAGSPHKRVVTPADRNGDPPAVSPAA